MSIDIDEAASAVERELRRLREEVSSLTATCEAYRVSYDIVAQEAEKLRTQIEQTCRHSDQMERERDLAEATLTVMGKHLVEYRKATMGEPNAVPPKPRVVDSSSYAPKPRLSSDSHRAGTSVQKNT